MHVVFGLVISGFEVIEQIENLKTDAASRPYADVRVIDCGVLATKSTKDGKSSLGVKRARIQVTRVEEYNTSWISVVGKTLIPLYHTLCPLYQQILPNLTSSFYFPLLPAWSKSLVPFTQHIAIASYLSLCFCPCSSVIFSQ